jgi:acyl-CoA reductase-like NAD-dependent aldehyde dehydrogenase
VEAHTYRMQAHTNADDATRYRQDDEVAAWVERDPVTRLEAYLREHDLLDDERLAAFAADAEEAVPMAYFSFGGWKSSLFGDAHAHGEDGVRFYTRGKVVTSRWLDPRHGGVSLGFPTQT